MGGTATNSDPSSDLGSRAFFHDNRLPYAEHYNFSLQRQFGSATVLSVSYVGTQAHRLLGTVEANPSNPALCASLMAAGCEPNAEDAGPFQTAAGPAYIIRSPYNAVVNGLNGPTQAFSSSGYTATMANSNYNEVNDASESGCGIKQLCPKVGLCSGGDAAGGSLLD